MSMPALVRFIRSHRSFFREITVYAVQTQSLTVLGLASAIIIPRILSQEAYGLYGVIFSIAGILADLQFRVVHCGKQAVAGCWTGGTSRIVCVYPPNFLFGAIAAAVASIFLRRAPVRSWPYTYSSLSLPDSG